MMTLWARACDLRFQIPQSSVADPGRGGAAKLLGTVLQKKVPWCFALGFPGVLSSRVTGK